ncbi:hypothetical protein [Tissierella sp.]
MDEKILLEDEELREEDVNIYGSSCGIVRIHCLYDCIDNTPWITSAQ